MFCSDTDRNRCSFECYSMLRIQDHNLFLEHWILSVAPGECTDSLRSPEYCWGKMKDESNPAQMRAQIQDYLMATRTGEHACSLLTHSLRAVQHPYLGSLHFHQ